MSVMSADLPSSASSTEPKSSESVMLSRLATPSLSRPECPRHVTRKIDLLLLAIEALDLGASEAIVRSARELKLDSVVRGRVHLWQLRTANSQRDAYQRKALSVDEGKALVLIITFLARQLTVLVRQLVMGRDQLRLRGLPLENHFRLADYLERFRAHFRARMNLRRAAVAAYNTDEKLDALALELLECLLFCTGTAGAERLWTGLFDGEVA
ncbi:MAG: DUF3038 domain-containing protein [Cyanobacteria bacterium P01_H01_bin.130]